MPLQRPARSTDAFAAQSLAPSTTAGRRRRRTEAPLSPAQCQASTQGTTTGVLLLAGVVVLALWLTIALSVRRDDARETQQAQASLGHLAQAVADRSERLIGEADLLARQVRAEWRAEWRRNGGTGVRLDLASLIAAAPAPGNSAEHSWRVDVYGPEGQVLATSASAARPAPALVDTLSAQARSRANADELLIGSAQPAAATLLTVTTQGGTTQGGTTAATVPTPAPATTAAPGAAPIQRTATTPGAAPGKAAWLLPLARRVDDGEGRLAALVVVSLPGDFLGPLLAQAQLGPRGRISLLGEDGALRASVSERGLQADDAGLAESLAEMRLRRHGALQPGEAADGAERLLAYRALEGQRLFAVVGQGVAEAHAAGRSRTQTWLTVGSVVTIVIALLTLHVLRRARQQGLLLQALAQSRQKAQAADELKSRLLLDLADGMRAPMQTILLRAEALRDTQPDPLVRRQAAQIADAAQQLEDRFSTMFEPSGTMPLDPLASHEAGPAAAIANGAAPSVAWDASVAGPAARAAV